jgi:hypothetical protein
MLKVGIKYCGGCNPNYDRIALFQSIEKALKGLVEFVSLEEADINLIFAIEGCKTACADLSTFDSDKIRVITEKEEAKYFIQELLDKTGHQRKNISHKVE